MKNNVPHQDFITAQKLLYEPNKLLAKDIELEKESHEYGACRFILNGKKIVFRVAKITPTKSGQFVTLWKRSSSGPIMPFDEQDAFDFVIISVRNHKQLGQFLFPKTVLMKHNVVSKNQNGGKRALRVYPPWVRPESNQAQKTQNWQLPFFIDIGQNMTKSLLCDGKDFMATLLFDRAK